LVVSKLSVLALPNYQRTLKMGAKLVAETSENLHILMRLSARENSVVVDFSKTHVSGNCSVPISSVGVVTTCHLNGPK
jgi:hypothetical protein